MCKFFIIVLFVTIYSCMNPVEPNQTPLDGPGGTSLDYAAPITELSISDLPGGSIGAIGVHGKTDTALYVNECWVFPGAHSVEFSMGRGTGWYNMREFIFEIIPNDRAVVIKDPNRYFKCWYYRVIY